MSKLEFLIGLMLACDCMIQMIELLLDYQLGYCFCKDVPQARIMSPSFQDRANMSRRHRFYGRYSCLLWVFQSHPLNLDRGPIGDDYGNPLISYWNSGHNWDDCGHIYWELFCGRICLFRGWCWFRSRDYWRCSWDCAFQDLIDGFHCTCCSVIIS